MPKKISKKILSFIFSQTLTFFYMYYELRPVHAEVMNQTIKSFGEYRVVLGKSTNMMEGIFIVYRGNIKIHEEREFGSYYWFGNHFDESLNGHDPHSGKDLTGKKNPNLVISHWTGGAHCCNYLSIYELGSTFRKLATVDGGSYGFRLVDLDNDKFPEIEFWDWPIDYLFSSFAGSAQGKTILKFSDGKYKVASNLMKRPIGQFKDLEKKKADIKVAFKQDKTPDIPYLLLELMMDLSYSGHIIFALDIAEEIWPTDRPGLAKFKLEFSRSLSSSEYWKDFFK